jgi:hypothetical protein
MGECDLEVIGVSSIFKVIRSALHCFNPGEENLIVFYYEVIKRELHERLIYECRCDGRLKDKDEGSTRLTYTGLCGGLEHLKIETRLIDERFASVMGECVI